MKLSRTAEKIVIVVERMNWPVVQALKTQVKKFTVYSTLDPLPILGILRPIAGNMLVLC